MVLKSRLGLFLLSVLGFTQIGFSQTTVWSTKMSDRAISLWPAGKPSSWIYDQGVVLRGVEMVYEKTNDIKYLQYIQNKTNYFVNNAGTISTYPQSDYNLDFVCPATSLLFLYSQTAANKYKLAADNIRTQLTNQPRTPSGGFWHKKIYPNQMWLDGLFMAEPFYARYSSVFNQPTYFDDIAKQFILLETKARDTTTGLLYHAWDESKAMAWSNPTTGCSPSFWSRSIGWYVMGLVDVLDYFPASHPKRDSLINILQRFAVAIVKYQDPTSGLWYQVTDKGNSAGNYLEGSGSSMFVYALAKGARKGYIDSTLWKKAKTGYDGIVSKFVSVDNFGVAHLAGTCNSVGLGGTPYRDGTYAYYTSVGTVSDDARGVGAFILAAVEIEKGDPTLITSIEQETSAEKVVTIFPNPVKNQLNIVGLSEEVQSVVRDVHGVVKLTSTGNLISMNGLENGVFTIELNDKGRRILKQFVKIE